MALKLEHHPPDQWNFHRNSDLKFRLVLKKPRNRIPRFSHETGKRFISVGVSVTTVIFRPTATSSWRRMISRPKSLRHAIVADWRKLRVWCLDRNTFPLSRSCSRFVRQTLRTAIPAKVAAGCTVALSGPTGFCVTTVPAWDGTSYRNLIVRPKCSDEGSMECFG